VLAVEPPPPLAPVERIDEILERFFLNDARLTGEVLAELALCDASAPRHAAPKMRASCTRKQPLIRKTKDDFRRLPRCRPLRTARCAARRGRSQAMRAIRMPGCKWRIRHRPCGIRMVIGSRLVFHRNSAGIIHSHAAAIGVGEKLYGGC